MHVIDVMAMVMEVMDFVIGLKLSYFFYRCDGDVDGYCYMIEAVMHVINMMAIMMEVVDIVIGFKV